MGERVCYHDPQVQRAYAECAEGYGFEIEPCPVRDPKKKGRVESAVKYVKHSFVPLREFRDLVYANAQLRAWLLGPAGNRVHGTTHEPPLTRFVQSEREFLRPLPTRPPELAVWARVQAPPRLPRAVREGVLFRRLRSGAPAPVAAGYRDHRAAVPRPQARRHSSSAIPTRLRYPIWGSGSLHPLVPGENIGNIARVPRHLPSPPSETAMLIHCPDPFIQELALGLVLLSVLSFSFQNQHIA